MLQGVQPRGRAAAEMAAINKCTSSHDLARLCQESRLDYWQRHAETVDQLSKDARRVWWEHAHRYRRRRSSQIAVGEPAGARHELLGKRRVRLVVLGLKACPVRELLFRNGRRHRAGTNQSYRVAKAAYRWKRQGHPPRGRCVAPVIPAPENRRAQVPCLCLARVGK